MRLVDVAIVAGLGLQLDADRERARDFAGRLERVGELVQQLCPSSGVGAGACAARSNHSIASGAMPRSR